ncbi:uncharacterized protein [Nerophis lumbriciformis]|uniref:uncharacterized protein isoform X2 n=1 Tax=Nerophis lumbriciformis TaxID=546530 RepID=UPI002ADFA95B|nr:uncharacterized protein LOC133605873 isoform X3 [Nerophis lumbriciformis]
MDSTDNPLVSSTFLLEKEDTKKDTEWNEASPLEPVKDKAEKNHLKKLRLKERSRLKKMEKTKKDDNDKVDNKIEQDMAKLSTSANDLCSDASDKNKSDHAHLCDSEGLDMTSSFVNNAAQRVQSKMDPKPTSKKHKKKPSLPAKDTLPEKVDESKNEAKDRPSGVVLDNVEISNKIAAIGNACARNGQFDAAVQNFTKAIQYNPTEYKFYGNRSFCFEKLMKYEKALADAEVSLDLCPGWMKGVFRKGRALAGLKRHEEAARAFQEVLRLDNTCIEASQEMMKVQIMQLMEGGFTQKQCTDALILHGTVQKAQEQLNELRSSEMNAAAISPPLPGPSIEGFDNPKPLELFPVWVGSLSTSVTESHLNQLFSKAGFVHSIKILTSKQCAFINFTQQESCQEAIRRFHDFELMGNHISVRYPDRMPIGMGISRSALKAQDVRNNYHILTGGRGIAKHATHRARESRRSQKALLSAELA